MIWLKQQEELSSKAYKIAKSSNNDELMQLVKENVKPFY
jgi:hypothetical protein